MHSFAFSTKRSAWRDIPKTTPPNHTRDTAGFSFPHHSLFPLTATPGIPSTTSLSNSLSSYPPRSSQSYPACFSVRLGLHLSHARSAFQSGSAYISVITGPLFSHARPQPGIHPHKIPGQAGNDQRMMHGMTIKPGMTGVLSSKTSLSKDKWSINLQKPVKNRLRANHRADRYALWALQWPTDLSGGINLNSPSGAKNIKLLIINLLKVYLSHSDCHENYFTNLLLQQSVAGREDSRSSRE